VKEGMKVLFVLSCWVRALLCLEDLALTAFGTKSACKNYLGFVIHALKGVAKFNVPGKNPLGFIIHA
jgi:hypothetical protein